MRDKERGFTARLLGGPAQKAQKLQASLASSAGLHRGASTAATMICAAWGHWLAALRALSSSCVYCSAEDQGAECRKPIPGGSPPQPILISAMIWPTLCFLEHGGRVHWLEKTGKLLGTIDVCGPGNGSAQTCGYHGAGLRACQYCG